MAVGDDSHRTWDEQHPLVTAILRDSDAVTGGIQMLDELVIGEVTHWRRWGICGDRHGWGRRLVGARARPKDQSPGGAGQAQKGSAGDPTPSFPATRRPLHGLERRRCEVPGHRFVERIVPKVVIFHG